MLNIITAADTAIFCLPVIFCTGMLNDGGNLLLVKFSIKFSKSCTAPTSSPNVCTPVQSHLPVACQPFSTTALAQSNTALTKPHQILPVYNRT
jgi:hypothetical protein